MDRLTITTPADFALLQEINPAVTTVSIENVGRLMALPLLPAHVRYLELVNVGLTGPVVLHDGLHILSLQRVRTEQPMQAWEYPASLTYLIMVNCACEAIDLTASTLFSVSLIRQQTPSAQVFLSESLRSFRLITSKETSLPWLPPLVDHLTIGACPELRDYSHARERAITTLTIDAPPSLYEVFPEVVILDLYECQEPLPEISLTHLRELSFVKCEVNEPVEINAPNLERLTFSECDPVDLRGSFAERVTRVDVLDSSFFPEADDWPSLEAVHVNWSEAYDGEVVTLPRLPWLSRLTTSHPVETNGVIVANINEYKAAWGVTRRKKGANVRELVRIVS